MSGDWILLDPTAELTTEIRPRRARAARLDDLTVGLLDIAKVRGDVFLDRLDELLSARGVAVRRYRKPRFSIPAPVALRQQIHAECDVVIEGLAD